MILHTLVLAAAVDSSTDPWHVLGNSYAERLALAALADLTLGRQLQIGPPDDDASPAARRLAVVSDQRPGGALGDAFDLLLSAGTKLDVDRAVRLLRDLAPAVEADLVVGGHLVETGQKGLLRKRAVLAVRPESGAEAQAQIRAGAGSAAAGPRALFLLAITGLPSKRATRLCGATPSLSFDPFEPFDPNSVAPDGHTLGPNAADLLVTLTTVLAATTDTTNDFD